MTPEDRKRLSDDERRQLLDEIRRRSEEAELRRIEEENKLPDQSTGSEPSADPTPAPASLDFPSPELASEPAAPAPFPGPSPFPSPRSTAASASEGPRQRLIILREQFNIAVDRKKVEKATEILNELAQLTPDAPDIMEMRLRVAALEESRRRTVTEARRGPAGHASDRHLVASPAVDQRTIRQLTEKAEAAYQHENYAGALEALQSLLAMDPGNANALRLKKDVERARDLAAQVAEEDARTRDSMGSPKSAVSPEKSQTSPASQKSQRKPESATRAEDDIWGTSVKPAADPMSIDSVPEQVTPKRPPAQPAVRRRPKGPGKARKIIKPLIALLVLGVLIVGGYYALRQLKSTVAPPHASILVLPAVSSAGNPAAAQIAEGLTDDLIRKLAMVSQLRVIAPHTAFALAASPMPPQQAARLAGAGLCLQSTLTLDRDRVMIQQQLFDSLQSSPVWSRQFDVSLEGVPTQRSEILGAIVEATGVHPGEEEQVALHKAPTTSGVAYQAYLQGRAMMRRSGAFFSPLQAVAAFHRAVSADSLFAEAYSALGWAHILAYESGDSSVNHIGKAVDCIERAGTFGLKNAETFRVWGAVEAANHQYGRAIERFEEAVSIAPSDAEARRRLAFARVIHGALEPALAAARQAAADDPLSVEAYVMLGLIQQYAAVAGGDARDDYQQALSTLQAGQRFAADRSVYDSRYLANVFWYVQQPDQALNILDDYMARNRQSYESLYMLGRVQQAAGRPIQEWREVLERSRVLLEEQRNAQPNDPMILVWLALVDTRLGAFKDGAALVKEAVEKNGENVDVLYMAARVYALQRDVKQATNLLSRAVDKRYELASVLDMDLFNLHGTPDYMKAVTR